MNLVSDAIKKPIKIHRYDYTSDISKELQYVVFILYAKLYRSCWVILNNVTLSKIL